MCWSQEKENNPRGTVQYLFGFLYMNYYHVYELQSKSF